MAACAGKYTEKVSIITPCMNSEKTIRQTMESVLNQTYKNIEYIVVDGGSSDGTLDIIREYLPRFHGRMRYISEKDKGIYDAMNKGIRMTRGGLIGIVCSDDYYEPDAVEKVLSCLTDDRYQVIYGYCRFIDKGHAAGLMKSNHKDLKQHMIPHPTCFVTRNIYRDFGMFLTIFKVSGDYELMLRLYNSGRVVFTQIRSVLTNFRIGGESNNLKRRTLENIALKYCHKAYSAGEALNRLFKFYLYAEYE